MMIDHPGTQEIGNVCVVSVPLIKSLFMTYTWQRLKEEEDGVGGALLWNSYGWVIKQKKDSLLIKIVQQV